MLKTNGQVIFFLIAQGFCGALVHAEEPLTLENALAIAQSANPLLQAADEQAKSALGQLKQDGIYPNPSLSVDYAVEKTIALKQDFEAPSKRRSRLALSRAAADIASLKREQTLAFLRADVEQAFYRLLWVHQRMELLRQQERAISKIQAQATQRYQPGLKNSVETVRIDLEAVNLRKALRQTTAEEDKAKGDLNALLARPSTAYMEIQGQLETPFPTLAFDELERDLSQSPELLLAEKEVNQKGAALEFARQSRLPDVSAGPNYSKGADEKKVGFSLGVGLPLWNQNKGAIAAAQAQERASGRQRDQIKIALSQEVRRQLRDYEAAQDQIKILRQDLLDQAARVVVQAQSAYQQGLITLTDYLDVLRTALQAKENYIEALWQSHQTLAELERRIGRPLE